MENEHLNIREELRSYSICAWQDSKPGPGEIWSASLYAGDSPKAGCAVTCDANFFFFFNNVYESMTRHGSPS